MFRSIIIDDKFAEMSKVTALFKSSFSFKERLPYNYVNKHLRSQVLFLAFYDDDLFCGFAYILQFRDYAFMLFLAIEKQLRNKGYGSLALKEVKSHIKSTPIILDIERVSTKYRDYKKRLKRRNFYLRNGYASANITYSFMFSKYDILINGGSITKQNFDTLWHNL